MYTIFIRMAAVFLMIFLGGIARKTEVVDRDTTRRLAMLVTRFLYPALIFSTIVGTFTLGDLLRNWYLPAGTVMIMAIGFGVGMVVTRLWPHGGPDARRALHFQCTINNYVFLPMPLVLMLWGEKGVAALVFSSVGSELSVWTLGVLALRGGGLSLRTFRRLLTVPMGAIAASALTLSVFHFSGWSPPADGWLHDAGESFMTALDMFGRGTVPMAMVIAGSRMADLGLEHIRSLRQGWVVVFRLVLIPALCVAMLHLLPFPEMPREILLLVAVMPSAIGSVVLSELYRADVEFAATSVLLTHLCSLVTIPVWLAFLL